MDRNEYLIRERKLRGWSQRYVAAQIGTQEKTVSAWECGQAAPSATFSEVFVPIFRANAETRGFFGPPNIAVNPSPPGKPITEVLKKSRGLVICAGKNRWPSPPQKGQPRVPPGLPRLG